MDQFSDCEPIFVVGAARSGTTMLQLMLNAHPDISVMGELHFFDQILEIRRWVPQLNSRSLDRFLRLWQRTEGFKYLPAANTICDRVRKRMQDEESSSYEAFYRLVMEEYAKLIDARRIGEKTPANIRYLEQLVRIFPKAKLVHVLRDPRSVVASGSLIPGASPDVVIHSLSWRCDIINGIRFRTRAANYIEVRYEDLVRTPQSALEDLCNFIGEKMMPEMLEFHTNSSSFIKDEPWKVGVEQPIYTESVDKWRERLSRQQAGLVERINCDLMDAFGYVRQYEALANRLLWPLTLAKEVLVYACHRMIKLLRSSYRTLRQDAVAPPLIDSSRSRQYRVIMSRDFVFVGELIARTRDNRVTNSTTGSGAE